MCKKFTPVVLCKQEDLHSQGKFGQTSYGEVSIRGVLLKTQWRSEDGKASSNKCTRFADQVQT